MKGNIMETGNQKTRTFGDHVVRLGVTDKADIRDKIDSQIIFTSNSIDVADTRKPVVEPCPVQQVSEYGDGAGDVFRSDLITVDTPVIVIPEHIVDICNFIQTRYPGKEFSILCKGSWGEKGWHVSKEYVIPKQKVSSASVYYKPDDLQQLKIEGWNTVIHSHPMAMQKFSAGDMSNINYHFPASILFCGGKFTDSTISVMVGDMIKMIIRPAITTEREQHIHIAKEVLDEQIEVETPSYGAFSQYGQTERQIYQCMRGGRSKNIEPVAADQMDLYDDPFWVWNGL
jgi:hypothetical protein